MHQLAEVCPLSTITAALLRDTAARYCCKKLLLQPHDAAARSLPAGRSAASTPPTIF